MKGNFCASSTYKRETHPFGCGQQSGEHDHRTRKHASEYSRGGLSTNEIQNRLKSGQR